MSENSILNNLEYDRTSGSLTYKDVRYLLIRPETIKEFQREMEKSLGEKAKEGFYKGGFRGGYLSSKKYKEVFNLSDKQIIEFMMRMGTEIGWGCFILNHFDIEKGIIDISVKNSPFVRPDGESLKGTCDLIRGIVGGMASIIFNQTCNASELECVSKGFDRCLFVVDLKLNSDEFLNGKRILVVDDEPDILASIVEILDMCIVDTALDFETANNLLKKKIYDAAVLDIMGVNGYELLEIAKNKNIPTLMLTAHALNPENFIKSIKKGAQAYIPKEKLLEIKIFLNDILTNLPKDNHKKNRWFLRLEKFFYDRFDPDWKENTDSEFWKKNYYN